MPTQIGFSQHRDPINIVPQNAVILRFSPLFGPPQKESSCIQLSCSFYHLLCHAGIGRHCQAWDTRSVDQHENMERVPSEGGDKGLERLLGTRQIALSGTHSSGHCAWASLLGNAYSKSIQRNARFIIKPRLSTRMLLLRNEVNIKCSRTSCIHKHSKGPFPGLSSPTRL